MVALTVIAAGLVLKDAVLRDGQAEASGAEAFVALSSSDVASYHEVVGLVTESGGDLRHGFMPNAMFVEMGAGTQVALSQHPGVALIDKDTVDVSALQSLGGLAATAAAAWNESLTGGSGVPPVPPTSFDDSNPPPIPPVEPPGGPASGGPASVAPGILDTATFLAGDVGYNLILLESDGGPGFCSPANPSSEDWSANQIVEVFNGVTRGMEFWARRDASPEQVIPQMLSLTVARTSCEPIARTVGDSSKWIADALTATGCPAQPASFTTAQAQCLHEQRVDEQVDWAFNIYVVNSFNDPDGEFHGGGVAYGFDTHLFQTYDNGDYTIYYMDRITAHEAGHVFGAADEYGSCNPAFQAGYLAVPNASCNNGGITTDISIMGGYEELIHPDVDVSVAARGAVGWRNPAFENGWTVVDVLRTSSTTFDALPLSPLLGNQPGMYATALSTPYPPGQGFRPISISHPKQIFWQLNGGPFSSATPADGAVGEEHEQFFFAPSTPLANGTYTFGAKSINKFGHESPVASRTVTIASNTAFDSDNDGCNDAREVGPLANQGGRRNPSNTWDYMNATGDGLNRVDDILAVVQKYFIDQGNPAYTVATDRTDDEKSEEPWDLGPPNGLQRVDDILAAVKQYFHDC